MRSDRFASTFGRFMLITCTAIFTFAGVSAHADANCSLQQVAALDLVVRSDHSVLLPVTIEGDQRLMFLGLQTLSTALYQSYVDEKHLKTRPLYSDPLPVSAPKSAGKYFIENQVKVPQLSIGQAQYNNSEFYVIPKPAALGQDDSVVGVLGTQMFAQFDVELDLGRQKLKLYLQQHCPGQVVYWSPTYSVAPLSVIPPTPLHFPVELDGKKVDATLSPSSITTLKTDVSQALYGFDEHSPQVEHEVDAAGHETSSYRAMKISATGFDVLNARVRLIPGDKMCSLATDVDGGASYSASCGGTSPMFIGYDVLRKLHIYMALKEKKIYYTRSDAGS